MYREESAAVYPAMLRLQGKRCLIVGGGRVAERKLLGLLEGGADDVVLISPDATELIRRLASDEQAVRWLQRRYRPGDAAEARLVFAATNDRAVNRAVVEEAESLGQWANAADESERGGFVAAAVVRRGPLVIAASAAGASPALAMRVKRELERRYGAPYAAAAAKLGELRRAALSRVDDPRLRRDVLRLAAERAADGAEAGWAHAGIPESAEQWLELLLQEMNGG